MKRFYCFNSKNFYGREVEADLVPGLRSEVRHGSMYGRTYSYVTFSDDLGIKWRIAPVRLGRAGMPTALKATGRDRFIDEQPRHEAATPSGFNELVAYIREREGHDRLPPDTEFEEVWAEFKAYKAGMSTSEAGQGTLPLTF